MNLNVVTAMLWCPTFQTDASVIVSPIEVEGRTEDKLTTGHLRK